MDETLTLGGNISLTGFRRLDNGEVIVIKKMVGNYTKKLREVCKKFEDLHITMKGVHERETSKLYEIHGKCLDNGTPITSTTTDRNLFVAVDDVLKNILKEATKY